MDTLIDMTPGSWVAWTAAFPTADEDTRLAALRNYIEKAARDAVSGGEITAAWANKKLPRVGVAATIETESSYVLEVPASGVYTGMISAANRAEAVRLFLKGLENNVLRVTKAAGTDWTAAAPVIVSGPEDSDGITLPDDAPTTVDATLVALREAILLAVVSGPRICEAGANDILADFGLGAVPDRKTFTVTRPVEGFASTTVVAFDEASALRVAEWRWEDQRGWTVKEADLASAGDLAAAEVAAS